VTDTRERIAAHVEARPGVHFRGLVRDLDLAPGQVQYHLRRLVGDEVVAEALYGRTHYYPPEFSAWERGALALVRRETARDVLGYLMAAGPTPPGEVAAGIDVARSTLEWHLDHLEAQGVVEKRRDGRRVTLALARPDDTADLLAAVEPSLPERMVDRFERLVDRLLEE
jgi:predicted transcriptional regulator